jgi:DNA recombination protein RmuC
LTSSVSLVCTLAAIAALLVGLVVGYLGGRRSTGSAHVATVAALERSHGELVRTYQDQVTHAHGERAAAVAARETAERELIAAGTRLAETQAQLAQARDQFEADRRVIEERIKELVGSATAKALNDANALLADQNMKQFNEQRAETLKSVETVTKPLGENLLRLQQSVTELDKLRAAGDESLKASLEAMAVSSRSLHLVVERSTTETAKLATALRDNRVRGRWGEIGLRNVLEKVGLTDHCDFFEQGTNEDGKRPDVIIKLPGDREVAVDAKTPFEAYMRAIEATDPAEQQRHMLDSVAAIRTKVRDLASKGYHKTPKAVGVTILYVQIESVMSAAMSIDPGLIENAYDSGIIIATPTTLLAYLMAFSREWSLHKQSVNAEKIIKQSNELIMRLAVYAERFAAVGIKLDGAVDAWNAAVGSFDGRLIPTATEIAALSGTTFAADQKKLPAMIETSVKDVKKMEALGAAAANVIPLFASPSSGD